MPSEPSMTAPALPFFRACRGWLHGMALLAAVLAAPAHADTAGTRAVAANMASVHAAFTFGRALVAPPRGEVVAAARQAVDATRPAPGDDSRRPQPYRTSCNFTTGCP
jgi:hypothetical protein